MEDLPQCLLLYYMYVERQDLGHCPYFFGVMLHMLAFVNDGMAQEKQKKVA